jgi:hypothetical protein
MNKLIILFICVLIASIQSNATAQYKDFVVSGNFIWVLAKDGTLKLFDKTDGSPAKKEVANSSPIVAITKDKTGRVVIADSDKAIKEYDEKKNTWKRIATYKAAVFGLAFTNTNKCFAITEKGIEDVESHTFYYLEKSVNEQVKHPDKWRLPSCHYMDRQNNLWVGFGYGEWGGDIFIFDTKNKAFVIPTFYADSTNQFAYLQGIKSFFEDSASVYFTSSTQHILTGGSISKFNKFDARRLLNSQSHWGEPEINPISGKKGQQMVAGEYIGPATYNSFTNSIYFYSQNGFFRGNKSKDLSDIKNWELVIKPELDWQSGQPDAVGSPMNVSKIEILDKDTFIYLSQNNGIGYVRGNALIALL